MAAAKHKVFISYHHANDQKYKEALIKFGEDNGLFIDASVDTGEIDEKLGDDEIRQKIRDEYLRDSTVTIVLVGLQTKQRKHVDWEIFSSMFDGTVNKKSGVLVINLPSTNCTHFTAAHGEAEKRKIYPDNKSWVSVKNRADYEKRYPHMPDRITDNLLKKKAKVSVTSWDKVVCDAEKLRFLINATFGDRAQCDYDMSRKMRRSNS